MIILLNNCKQNITSLSLLVGMTVRCSKRCIKSTNSNYLDLHKQNKPLPKEFSLWINDSLYLKIHFIASPLKKCGVYTEFTCLWFHNFITLYSG